MSSAERLREHQIDRLIMNRLIADPKFRVALLRRTAPSIADRADSLDVKVRMQERHVGATGTIDVVARFCEPDGKVVATLLFEDKISAGFTPSQPERYIATAAALSGSGCLAVPVLCAPRGYLLRSRYASIFPARFALEELGDLVDGEDEQILRGAVAQFEMPAEPDPVPEVADFFRGYRELAAHYAPDLHLKVEPNTGGDRPNGSFTLYFDTRRTLPSYAFLPTLRFSHQCQDKQFRPSVKVMFAGWTPHVAAIAPLGRAALAGTSFYLRPAGNSLALVADTPPMNNRRPVFEQLDAVREGLRAASRLRAWLFGNEEILARWANAAR